MSRTTHLLNRNGSYYCRIKVPKDYQEVSGKKEIWKSLGKMSHSEACQKVKLEASRILSKLGSMNDSRRMLENDDIALLAENHYHARLSRDEFCRMEVKAISHDGEKDFTLEGYQELLKDVSTHLTQGNWEEYKEQANMQLAMAYLSVDTSQYSQKQLYKQLCFALMNSAAKALEVIIARHEGDWSEGTSSGKVSSAYSVVHGKPSVTITSPLTLSFGELINKFNAASETQVKSDSVKEKYANYQSVILELVGTEKDISEINRTVCRELVDGLKKLPKNAKKKYPKLSIQTILEQHPAESEQDKLSISTLNDYIEHCSMLLTWGRNEGYDIPGSMEGLKFKEKTKASEKRDSFTLEQLNLIFSEEGVCQFKRHKGKEHQFWIPVIALLTGMRIGEICQLNKEDIKTESDITFISINEQDGKSVKTETSIRKVPISSLLKEIGFLTYVGKIRGKKLFPQLGSTKNPSDAFSKWFTRRLTKLEIKKTEYSFHSFRHSYRDFVRESEANDVALEVAGWQTEQGVHSIYGSGHSIKQLKKAIDSIEFNGVQLFETNPTTPT